MARSASTDQGYAVPRPYNLENKRTGLRSNIRPTPKVAEREQSILRSRPTRNRNPKTGKTKLLSAKLSIIKPTPIKARKEKAKKGSRTKSSFATKIRENAENQLLRFSPYVETDYPYPGVGYNALKLATEDFEEEPLGYPLEHTGGCQLPDAPSNTIYGKVCVCITSRPSSETEEEDPTLSLDDVEQYASKALTLYNINKETQDFRKSSSSPDDPSIKEPERASECLQAPTIPVSRYCDTNIEFKSMFPLPPTQSLPITLPVDFTLPVPPLLKYATSSWFIPGQVPPKARGLDLIAIPTDLESPRVCTEYYSDEFFSFIQRFRTLEADFVVRVHNRVLDITQKTHSNLASHLRYLPTSDPQEWISVRGTRKLMALRRIAEIMYGILNEIQGSLGDSMNEIFYREIRGMVVEDDRMEGTWREYDVDETWEVAFRSLREVFVHESTWEHTREFCRLLMHEFAEPLREYWGPIVVYHFGRGVETLADWTFVSN